MGMWCLWIWVRRWWVVGGGLKKKCSGSRSWLLLDASGLETVLYVDKYEIMHRLQIHAHDLQILDPIISRNLDRVQKLKSQMTRSTAHVQKVRDELEQLLDDDDDVADLYLSRKLAGESPVSGSGAASRFFASPTIGSKISRASRASIETVRGDENDVE